MGGKNILLVKFRFFDLLSIQILVPQVSLSRHLRTAMPHFEPCVAGDKVEALVMRLFCHRYSCAIVYSNGLQVVNEAMVYDL